MKIKIHQAVYGEKDNGHTLLRHSFDSKEIAQAIALKTDLPAGHANYPGRNYYLGSLTHTEYFIILKSIPDNDANRTAFVHTFALFIEKKDLAEIHDLSQIIQLFPDEYKAAWSPQLLNIELSKNTSETKSISENTLARFAYNLINNNKTTIWLGENGFEDLICLFWNRLPWKLRHLLKFRVSFGPNDINEKEKLTIAYTPENLINKWESFPILKTDEAPNIPTTSGLDYLINLDKTKCGILKIIESLGITLESFSTIKDLSRLNEFIESSDLNDQLDAIDRLHNLAPKVDTGKQIKAEIAQKINSNLKKGTIENILLFRNIKVNHLPEKTPFNTALKTIIKAQIIDQLKFDTVEEILNSHVNQNMEPWLSNILLASIRELCNNWDDNISNLFWNILLKSKNPKAIIVVFDLSKKETESSLIRTLPKKIDSKKSTDLIAIAKANKWFKLHAHLLIKTLPDKEILECQFNLDPSMSERGAFEVISKHTKTLSFIQFTLEHRNEVLISIAVDLLTTKPNDLKYLDVTQQTWLEIWARLIKNGNPAFQGIQQPQAITYQLLDTIIEGKEVPEPILMSIAKTETGDIADYHKRAEVWKYMTVQTKNDFISKSLFNSIHLFLINPNQNPIEPEISSKIDNSEKLVSLLSNEKYSNSNRLKLFNLSDNLRETVLIRHLNTTYKKYSVEDCKTLGELLNKRKWAETYKKVKLEFVKSNDSFSYTIETCKNTFPIFESSLFDSFSQIFSGSKAKNEHAKSTKIMMSHKRKVLILTAIEIEYKTVKSFLNDYKEVSHPTTGSIYGSAAYGNNWDVLLVETEAGNNNAAIEAERAITFFKPEYVLFIGVAGGLKDVKIGDVVVASKVYGTESAKADKELLSRHEFGQPTHRIKEIAKALRKDDNWLKVSSEQISSIINREFQLDAYLKPIVAGEKVVSSTESDTYKYIKKNAGDALAVEMEGIGFLKACYAHQDIQYILIRGISDLVDHKSQTDQEGGQQLACLTASAFAFEMLNRIDLQTN